MKELTKQEELTPGYVTLPRECLFQSFHVVAEWPRGRKTNFCQLTLVAKFAWPQPLIKPLTPIVGSLLYVTPLITPEFSKSCQKKVNLKKAQ